jgi:hypothetical protein
MQKSKSNILSDYQVIPYTHNIALITNNAHRFKSPAYYFSDIQPSLQKLNKKKGYYMYSYAENLFSSQPSGSTNYTRLNAFMRIEDCNDNDLIIIAIGFTHVKFEHGYAVIESGDFEDGIRVARSSPI